MKNLLIVALLSIAFVSCTKEDVEKPVDETEVKALVTIEVEMKDGTKIYSEQKRP